MANVAQIPTINDNSLEDVVGTRTRGDRMVAQTNPLSYGGTPSRMIIKYVSNIIYHN